MANIFGTVNNDSLVGTPDADFILAYAGNDTLLGQEGNDTLNGNQENDIINGNDGNDYAQGGQGNDTISDDSGNDTLFGDQGNDSILGGVGNDVINGNQGDDTINGNEGNDTVRGGQGNDLLGGGQNDDQLYGDLGDDTLWGDLGNDTLFGDDGNDNINGNDDNDVINGNQGNDTLNGNEGNDTVRGGQGNDLLRGGQNDDQLNGDLGNDTLYGDLGNDTINGADGNDVINGNQGNDVINGNQGNDTVWGGKEDDLLWGGQGDDQLYGDLGNDTLFGDLGNDTINGGEDNDLLNGNNGNDVINGNAGADTIRGGQSDDIIRGGAGNDSLFGDKGSDTIFGDLGADTLTGNTDDTLSDTFVVGLLTGATTKTTGGPTRADADIITDFQPCIDLISLTGGISYTDLDITQGTGTDASNTIITDKSTGEFLAVLLGINSDFIDATDFLPSGPPTVRVRANDPLAAEPAASQAQNLGEFTISVPCAPTSPLVVNYTIGGTATNGTDYNSLSDSVTIPTGSNSVTIPVIPIADALADPDETVTLTLTPNADYNIAASPNNSATVTIADSLTSTTTLSTILISATKPNTSEGGSPGEFQIIRTGGDPTQTLTVELTFTGTATPDDYTLSSTTVTFEANDFAPKTITVTPTTAGGLEPTETVVATLAENPNYTVGASDTATVRITDSNPLQIPNNVNPVLRFNSGGTFQNGYGNINAAVNDSLTADGDIIFVRSGTHSETSSITITKELTIWGPNTGISPASGFSVTPATVSAPLNSPVFTINPGLSDVTIQGLTIQLNGENGIRQQKGSTNLTIRQNEFTGNGPADGGVIYLDFEGSGSGANVIDNLIRDINPATVTSGIQLYRINGARATNNLLTNLGGPGIVADALTGTSNVINDNGVENIKQQGIQLAGGNATIANNDITNANTAHGADDGGIRLRNSILIPGTLLDTVNVLSNTIVNSFNGVAIRTPADPDRSNVKVSGAKINNNNLINNSNAGLFYGGDTTLSTLGQLNATNNWWGVATGPVTTGTGQNAILGPGASLVTYSPFATAPF